MRLPVLAAVVGTALALAACKNNDQHDNTQNIDENLTAENIVSNDVTAIDAVTGDAANMAADVNYMNVDENISNGTNAVAPSAGAPANREPTPRPKPTTTTASSPPPPATSNAAD
jgi:DNA helicase TIP49 (TBP-interacting protein)